MKSHNLLYVLIIAAALILQACDWNGDGKDDGFLPFGLSVRATEEPAAAEATEEAVANCKDWTLEGGEWFNYNVKPGEETVIKGDNGDLYVSCSTKGRPTTKYYPQVTPTPRPVITDTPTSGSNGSSAETFSYTPGGEGFGKWATDVVHPSGYKDGTCGRVWQATNLENLTWVTMFCNWETSDPAPRLQWTHPTELTITDTGTVKFELWRDHGADNASNPSPYDVANVKDSPLGLGWFAQGFNAEICVNGKCQPLNGGGVFQIGFPKDFKGHYDISISVNGGQAHFWQGEKLTSVDNWPIPAK